MPAQPTDDTNGEAGAGRTDSGRSVELETADGVMVYDPDNHQSWLYSESAVSLAENR